MKIKKRKGKVEYIVADDVRKIAEVVQQKFQEYTLDHINLDAVWFIYEKNRRRKRYNKVIPAFILAVKEPYRTLTNKVYIIAVTDSFYSLDDDIKELVILHELLHIPASFDGKIVPHNVEDFREIIDKYGLDWLVI